MEKVSCLRRVVILCALMGAMVASCKRSAPALTAAEEVQRANGMLTAIKLPVLPDGVTDVRSWAGGVFAKFMNVKFSASPDQALDYLKRIGVKQYHEFDLSPYGAYRVLTTHFLAEAEDRLDQPVPVYLSSLTRRDIYAQPWFESVYDIRHGWYYGSEAGVEVLEIYYDLDSGQFYINWSYS